MSDFVTSEQSGSAPAVMPDPGPPGAERTEWLQLAVICAAGFVVWSGFGAILPYLPVFLQEEANAPVWHTYMSGYVISLGGVTLVGLAIAAPTLRREWERLQGERASAAGPDAGAQSAEVLTALPSEEHWRL